jgi:hypothetical protein
MNKVMARTALAACAISFLAVGAWASTSESVDVEITVMAFAEIEFIDTPLLEITIPPPGSTFPLTGKKFVVRGNAKINLAVTPDDYIVVDRDINGNPVSPRHLGRAVGPGAVEIGYNLMVEIPETQLNTSLPSPGPGPITKVLDTAVDGWEIEGWIFLTASHHWTPAGSPDPPGPGLYEGEVVMQVTAFE